SPATTATRHREATAPTTNARDLDKMRAPVAERSWLARTIVGVLADRRTLRTNTSASLSARVGPDEAETSSPSGGFPCPPRYAMAHAFRSSTRQRAPSIPFSYRRFGRQSLLRRNRGDRVPAG